MKQAVEYPQPTSFIEYPEKLSKPKYTPFDRAWIAPNIRRSSYDSLVVDAVRSDLVNYDSWIFSAGTFIPTRTIYMELVTELAQ